eukprot:6180774-Pleurochrysis_carterae.AAC.2
MQARKVRRDIRQTLAPSWTQSTPKLQPARKDFTAMGVCARVVRCPSQCRLVMHMVGLRSGTT